MNRTQQSLAKHNQLKIIEFCRDNDISFDQLKRTAELMQHQESIEKSNLLLKNSPRISMMEFRGDYL